MDTAPTLDNPATHSSSSQPGLRTAAYCALLAALAAVLMFWELGADALSGDEAQYALVVQNIKRTGAWLHVTPYPPTPYLQKPPLYFWLTAATYDLFGPTELAYRVWSAAAGVGAVALTCVLGALLFTPEVGALAGLLLMTNRAFLLVHGARSGTFDTLVTFLLVAGVVLYALVLRGRASWVAWIGIGIAAGLASMTKPFVGVPLVALLAIHALFVDRRRPFRLRLAGPVVALFCLALVAAPWYVAQWQKFPEFAGEMFRRNLYERAFEGVDDKHVEDWKYYVEQLSKSSVPFLPAIPAALYGVYRWAKGPRRTEYALLVTAGLGWVALFSFSASKAIHYIYPAFPLFAVMIAAGASCAWGGRGRRAIILAAALLAAFSFHYARTLYYSIPADRSPYLPWEMYKTIGPAIARGEAQVIFYGFPDAQIDWRSQLGLRARDCYYLEQMRPGARWTREWGELANELHPQKPSLLILARGTNVNEMLPKTNLMQRTDDRFVYPHPAYLLLGVDLQPLLSTQATPDEPDPSIRIDAAEVSSGMVRLAVSPPLIAPARLSVRLRVADQSPRLIRYTFSLAAAGGAVKTLEDATARVSAENVVEVSALIEQDLLAEPAPHAVTLTLLPPQAAGEKPVILSVQEARLSMQVTVPPEPHPRR